MKKWNYVEKDGNPTKAGVYIDLKYVIMNGVASPILGQERGREYARSIYFIYSFYHGKCSSLLYLQMAGWR